MQKSLHVFFLEVLLWLPVMFAAWYYVAPVLNAPVGWLLEGLTSLLLDPWVETIEQHDREFEVITRLELVPTQPGAVFAFNLNPLLYGYGLPLLAGLCFASPDTFKNRLLKVALGWLVIALLAQLAGLYIEVIKVLVYHTSREISLQVINTTWIRDLLALSFQFTTLILPVILPVILWLFLYRKFWQPALSERLD